jgi:RimJ/RimL family protein N-acetyltransferase
VTPDAETLKDGSRVLVRPVAAQDADRLREAFRRLSPASRYRRFHAPMANLPGPLLRYLTQVDHRDHEALVGVTADGEDIVGVARFVRHRDDPAAAEVAVTVLDDWQGRGLGRLLLERLADRAREEDVRRFTALVQPENEQAADLLARLGPVRRAPRDATVQLDIELAPVELDFELPEAGLGARLDGALRGAARSLLSAPWYPRRLLELLDAVAHPSPGPLLRRLRD